MKRLTFIAALLWAHAALAAPGYKIHELEKGEFIYKNLPQEIIDEYELDQCELCEHQCRSNISYIELTHNSAASQKLNEQFKQSATSWTSCEAVTTQKFTDEQLSNLGKINLWLTASSFHTDEVLYLSDHFLSVRSMRWQRGLGGQGSCHGGYHYSLYNLNSGQQYFLPDAIQEKYLDDFTATAYAVLKEKSSTNSMSEEEFAGYIKNQFNKLPVFIRDADWYANLGEVYPYIGCAMAQDFPIRLRTLWLKHSLLSP